MLGEHLKSSTLIEMMERLDRSTREASNVESVVDAVLSIAQTVFKCDSAYLLSLDDGPNRGSKNSLIFLTVRGVLHRTADHNSLMRGSRISLDERDSRRLLQVIAESKPVIDGFDLGITRDASDDASHGNHSRLQMAFRFASTEQWLFGIEYLSCRHQWTCQEAQIFEIIGHHLTYALSVSLTKSALQESKRSFGAIAENSLDNIIRYDLECRMIYINPRAEQLFGEPRDILLGKTPREATPTRQALAYQTRIFEVIQTGQAQEVEFAIEGVSGDTQVHRVRLVAERNDNGEVVGVCALGSDVTTILETDRRLQESYDLLRAIVNRREAFLESQRRSIALEINDELGQHLTALSMGLSAAKLEFAKPDSVLAHRLQQLIDQCTRSVEVVRSIATAVRPAVLDLGLTAAIDWLVRRASNISGRSCKVCHDLETSLNFDEETSTTIFRVVEEALGNAIRHAKAHEIVVTSKYDGSDATIQVSDDGIGFDLASIGKDSFGIFSMRAKALLLRGSISFESRLAFGTTVTLTVPLTCPP